jgi:hypothetical protein
MQYRQTLYWRYEFYTQLHLVTTPQRASAYTPSTTPTLISVWSHTSGFKPQFACAVMRAAVSLRQRSRVQTAAVAAHPARRGGAASRRARTQVGCSDGEPASTSPPAAKLRGALARRRGSGGSRREQWAMLGAAAANDLGPQQRLHAAVTRADITAVREALADGACPQTRCVFPPQARKTGWNRRKGFATPQAARG